MLLSLLVLLLFNEFVLDHPLDALRVVLGDISDALATRPHESLQCQVVASRQGVVLVGLDEAPRLPTCPIIEGVLIKDDLQLIKVNWNWILADNNS